MEYITEALSVQLIEEYYNGNTTKFFEYMDDDVIWIGPGAHQYIWGKKTLKDAFAQEQNTLKFSTEQLSSKTIPGGSTATNEVVVRFVVYTYYESGYVSMHNQRITLFWKRSKKDSETIWRYALIHISDGLIGDERDMILPLHLDDYVKKSHDTLHDRIIHEQNARLIAKGEDYSTYYIEQSSIEYAAAGKAKFTDICTKNGVIRVRLIIDQVDKMLSEQFYRPHRSYLVNIFEIAKLDRNKIILKNNVEIPIPSHKYNQVKEDIAKRIEKLQSKNDLWVRC